MRLAAGVRADGCYAVTFFRALLPCGLLGVLLSPASAGAQHASPRALLDPPSDKFALACRTIDPPNRTLPSSVLSYELSYGTLQNDSVGSAPRLIRHQRFVVVWDSVGHLVLFSAEHAPTDTDSLQAGFFMVATDPDTFEGRWLVLADSMRLDPMNDDDLRAAQNLAAHLWMRRCPRTPPARLSP